MTDKNFDFYLLTRQTLAKVESVFDLVKRVKMLVGMRTVWFVDQSELAAKRYLEFGEWHLGKISECLDNGGILLTGQGEMGFELLLDRVGKFSYITLSLERRYLDEDHRIQGFIEFSHRLFEQLNADFAFAYLARQPGFDISYLVDERSLELGLRDTYWLTIFGPEYCKLIGYEKLLNAPSFATHRLGNRSVSIQASSRPDDDFDRQQLRNYIGAAYFVPCQGARHPISSEETGLLAVSKHLVRLAFGKSSASQKAELVPKF